MSTRIEIREKILAPFKEQYATGDYIIVSGSYIIGIPNWECFDFTEIYILKKDKEILIEFLKDNNIKIEFKLKNKWQNLNCHFLKNYDKDIEYRLKY